MLFFSFLYSLIISPLVLFFEVVFSIANRLIGNAGLAIIFLSLAVNFLVLPLYKRADELQKEERDIQQKMEPMVKHIRRTFKGDERFLMLQECYRMHHYKPIYSLKSSVSLLLQIPFFIAAYNLLSNMQDLKGMPFGFIADLGREDAMFTVNGFPVNVLPILMTVINIISGIIYTKGRSVKDKIQTYGLAVIFLVLLYHSPSGLVFYWLLNNVFSLLKNVFYKLKHPGKVLKIMSAAAGAALLVATVARTDLDLRQKILLSVCSILLCLPLVFELFNKNHGSKASKPAVKCTAVFFMGTVLLSLITGLLIPSAVINDSALEFIDIMGSTKPISYILNSMCLSFGTFVFWGGVFFFFMNGKLRETFCKAVWIICGVSVIDYLLFGTNLGIMTSALQYEKSLSFTVSEYLINILAVILVSAVFLLIFVKLRVIVKPVLIIGMMTVIAIGGLNAALVAQSFDWYEAHTNTATDTPSIPLSKNGKNVIVIMLDRAMGTEIPYIFNEKPELKEKFDGFTYYPNTISYGSWTVIGAPALYGGYEYTPERINARSTEKLKDKHNEALRVMPVLFGDNGFNVTVCDPSYAGYSFIPNLSIYADHPEFNCYNLSGRYNYFSDAANSAKVVNTSERLNKMRNRNFFCFSLMKISPLILQETIYDDGLYNESVSETGELYDVSLSQHTFGLSKSTGFYLDFLNAFTTLTKLPEITTVSDSTQNTFFMMSNDTAHSPCLLQEPDYVPSISVDNTKYDVDMVSRYTIGGKTMKMEDYNQVMHYHVNMASYLQFAKWFDYMRENGVYDNTRIIIVADHGRALGQFNVNCNGTDMEYFTPALLVKDFNATGFNISKDFMTNADTPTIATSGLIKDPVNPFTGKKINSDAKAGPQKIFWGDGNNSEQESGNVFYPGSWFSYEGNDPLDPKNWKFIGNY